MHYTALPKFHLSRFHPGMKLLLTLYLGSVLAGLVGSILMFTARMEPSLDGVRRHYQGDPVGSTLDEELAPIEPRAIELGMTSRRIVEILHPHLFSVPLVLLVVCHLFALTNARPAVKMAGYLAAFGGFFVLSAGMALAPLGTPGVLAVFAGAAALVGGTAAMCVGGILAAWLGRPPARA